MKYDNYSVDEIIQGYSYNSEKECFICAECFEYFYIGQIYKINDNFYESSKAIKIHLEEQHSDRLEKFILTDNKYLNLTSNQKDFLLMYARGKNDNNIAKDLDISNSTVRHQRFMLNQKAKSAKMFLALYEMISISAKTNKDSLENNENQLINLQEGATMIDNRYDITNEEAQKIIQNNFSSIKPLKLIRFPVKEKKKIVILNVIINEFEKERKYTEKEINAILKDIYFDFATLRRYFIEYGYMNRTNNCNEYWLL